MRKPTPFDACEIHPITVHQTPDGRRFAKRTAEIYARITGHGYDADAPETTG